MNLLIAFVIFIATIFFLLGIVFLFYSIISSDPAGLAVSFVAFLLGFFLIAVPDVKEMPPVIIEQYKLTRGENCVLIEYKYKDKIINKIDYSIETYLNYDNPDYKLIVYPSQSLIGWETNSKLKWEKFLDFSR